jgi:hypothetical protein
MRGSRAAAVAALAAISALTLASCSATSKGGATVGSHSSAPTVTSQSASVSEEPAVVYHEPAKEDFTLTVKTLEKECFGSAGCNITFRVVLEFVNDIMLDPSKTYEITYDVKGGDEPLTNTLKLTGENYEHDDEEFISTSKSSAKLKAVITDVSEY